MKRRFLFPLFSFLLVSRIPAADEPQKPPPIPDVAKATSADVEHPLWISAETLITDGGELRTDLLGPETYPLLSYTVRKPLESSQRQHRLSATDLRSVELAEFRGSMSLEHQFNLLALSSLAAAIVHIVIRFVQKRRGTLPWPAPETHDSSPR